MSEKNFNVNGTVTITAGKIISVEKGNVEKPVPIPVCAFSMQVEGSALPVKVILKGDMARKLWRDELKDGKSAPTGDSTHTIVNVTAEVREVREKEFVVHNPSEVEFFRATSYRG